MPYVKPELSFWERIGLTFVVLRTRTKLLFCCTDVLWTDKTTVSNGLYTSITGPFRGSNGSAKYINHIKLSMTRTFLNNSTVRQQQTIAPSTDEAYPHFAKTYGFQPSKVELSDGTKAYWFGNREAEKVILWFHGGGYNLHPDPGHLLYLNSLASEGIGVLMLAYTLAPQEVYPHQLRQAVELLRHVITKLDRHPQNVTVAGDSAGGNLALGVLSHLMHPHPEITPLRLPHNQKLNSAILLAPWVSLNTDWPSNTYNASKDLVTIPASGIWSSSFLGGKPRDAYNEPLSVDPSWWEGLDGVVEEILIVGGADEVLVDSIREFGKIVERVHGKVTTVIAEGEWHNMPVIFSMGMGGQQSEVIERFVKSRL